MANIARPVERFFFRVNIVITLYFYDSGNGSWEEVQLTVVKSDARNQFVRSRETKEVTAQALIGVMTYSFMSSCLFQGVMNKT